MTIRRMTGELLRNQHGIALPMVLVIFVIGFALVGAFMVAIVGSANVSNTTRSGVQAQAAAEAGIEAAKVSLTDASSANVNFCTAFPSVSSNDPKYVVTGQCDNNSAPTKITLISISDHPSGGFAKVEAVLPVTAGSTEKETAGGPSIVFANSITGALSGYSLDAVNSEVDHQDFYIRTGSVACWNSATYSHSFYLYGGSFTNGSSCTVNGDIYASDGVTLQGTINGDIVSHKASGDIIYQSARVNGNFWSKGTLSPLQAPISGNVTLAGTGTSTMQNNAQIGGSLTHRGTVNGATGRVSGAIVQSNSPTIPDFPEIQPWQDVTFVAVTKPDGSKEPPAAWKDAGYALEVVSGGAACSKWYGNSFNVTSVLSGGTSKIIYDIRNCGPNGGHDFDTNSGGAVKTVRVQRDFAVIANSWQMSATVFESADGQSHTIHFITPDGNPAASGPQCAPGKDSELLNKTLVDPKLAIYIYTPCNMKFNGTSATFRGQVYAGSVSFGGGVTMAFAPRSIPGYDFGTGGSPTHPGSGGSGTSGVPSLSNGLSTTPSSQRNVS